MNVICMILVSIAPIIIVGCGQGTGPPPPRDARQAEGHSSRAEAGPRGEGIQSVGHEPVGTVVFTGGYETDPQDHGRPVALIAAALGVKTEVFRQAFSNVKPAQGRGPSEAEAQANKKVLLDALSKHGVTNERLDEVSNYYRYQPQSGELWRHTPATATATISNGQVVALKITNPGSGYMTPPTVIVAGHPTAKVEAVIEFSQDLKTNGRVTSLTLVK
ncbi:MAG: hypothetical protein HQ518_01230 [Rhodopirellula sp.]|nr:hypothetical protein [Rhodopirellula sp.]